MTQRTKLGLDALFPDNVDAGITAARLRDFVESCVPSRGELHFDDPVGTVVVTPLAFVKAVNVTTMAAGSRFSMPVNNRLRYDGVADVTAEVLGVLGVTCADDAQVVAVGVALNGVLVDASVRRLKLDLGASIHQVVFLVEVALEAGDYLEVYVTNETSVAGVTIDHGSFRASAFLT